MLLSRMAKCWCSPCSCRRSAAPSCCWCLVDSVHQAEYGPVLMQEKKRERSPTSPDEIGEQKKKKKDKSADGADAAKSEKKKKKEKVVEGGESEKKKKKKKVKEEDES